MAVFRRASELSRSVFLKAVRFLVHRFVTVCGNQFPARVVRPIEVCLVESLPVMPSELPNVVRFLFVWTNLSGIGKGGTRNAVSI